MCPSTWNSPLRTLLSELLKITLNFITIVTHSGNLPYLMQIPYKVYLKLVSVQWCFSHYSLNNEVEPEHRCPSTHLWGRHYRQGRLWGRWGSRCARLYTCPRVRSNLCPGSNNLVDSHHSRPVCPGITWIHTNVLLYFINLTTEWAYKALIYNCQLNNSRVGLQSSHI